MTITERKLKNGKIVYDNAFMYKNIRYKKGGFRTKKEANSWESLIKSEVDKHGIYQKPCEKTFIQVWDDYISLNKQKYARATLKTYQASINRIKENPIADKKIIELDYSMIQSYFNVLSVSNKKGVCVNDKKIFAIVFKHAIRNGYIKHNPLQYIEIAADPAPMENHKKKTISTDEFNLICNYFLNKNKFNADSIYIALNIGYYTGARISEALALTKSDINFNNHTITFNKRLDSTYNKNALKLSKMKTKSSYATLPLAKPLEKILKEWFDKNPYEIICCDENGSYLSSGNLFALFKRMSNKLNINFHYHMLRHTYASTLVNNGINVNVAKELLRHATINTTLDIYTHSNTNEIRQALNSTFNKDLNKITPKLPNLSIN